MTATVTTALSAANNAAKTVTTPAGVTATQALLVFIGTSGNDTITQPGSGTWAEVTLTDNTIGSSNGQLRVYQCLNPASSTAYTWVFSSTRFSVGALLLDVGSTVIASGSIVDIAASLESVAGLTHAPPTMGGGGFPTAAGSLVVDCLMFRQFNPDVSTCTPPATGLTWTEQLDFRGNDAGGSGQNVQMAINTATGGAANTAISTAALNTVDANEPSMVARIVIKGGSGGGSTLDGTVAAATTATLTSTGVVTAQATAAPSTTAALASTATVATTATTAPATTAALAATAVVIAQGSATLTTTATLAASAAGGGDAAVSAASAAALTSTGVVTAAGVAAPSTTATLAAIGAKQAAASAALATSTALLVTADVSGQTVRATSSAAVTARRSGSPLVTAGRTSASAVTARASSSGGVG